MLTGVHFLLTYNCNFECDHCFLHCGPSASGTFTAGQLREVFRQMRQMNTITSVYFEGGEPFLYYPLLLYGLGLAREFGYQTGIVTNAYWATTVEDAGLWLDRIKPLKVTELSLSDDLFHHDDKDDNPARRAHAAANTMGVPASLICIDEPTVTDTTDDSRKRGEPVIGGGAMFKGRAAEKLTNGLPRRPWRDFTTCPHEELEQPKRVHLDPFGHVHLCQGLSMGNVWKTPLAEMVAGYDPQAHPICGPLIRGGPAALAEAYSIPHEDTYVDECHLCYTVRKALVERFPEHLCPRQVYGLQ